MSSSPHLALSFDVGGTFTDFTLVDLATGQVVAEHKVPTDPDEAAHRWADYSGRWTRWNTLRAVGNILSLLLVGLAIFVWGRQG